MSPGGFAWNHNRLTNRKSIQLSSCFFSSQIFANSESRFRASPMVVDFKSHQLRNQHEIRAGDLFGQCLGW